MSNALAKISALLLAASLALHAQPAVSDEKFGGKYEKLRPEQSRLVEAWLKEYEKVFGKKQKATEAYDQLPLSVRTTFEAITHALSMSKLSDENGKPLGTALDLVQLPESVHGKIPGARGDHQFRMYVLLKKSALDTLYKSREFKRTRDNTHYHIGYPINFRQQGGAPSIQFSLTRTGRRADIDVDYRSSSGPQALLNGHLTSANSDVRAGNNFEKHVDRWQGFENWWRQLFGLIFAANTESEEPLPLSTEPMETPKVKGTTEQDLLEATKDFLESWLVEKKPAAALAYLSPRSYACLADFQTGETVDSGLARLRILKHMQDGSKSYPGVTSLTEVLGGFPSYQKGARPVVHPMGNVFSVEQLPDNVARELDCRTRLRVNMAEQLPEAGDQLGDFYMTLTKFVKQPASGDVLSQIWTREEGYWKVVSWHVEHPLRTPETITIAKRATQPAQSAKAIAAEPQLVETATRMISSWLVERNYGDALAFFDPEAYICPDLGDESKARAFLKEVGDAVPKHGSMAEAVHAVEHGHEHFEELQHAHSKEFTIARVSDDLAAMLHCRAGVPAQSATSEKPTFRNKLRQTVFVLEARQGHAAALSLVWEQRDGAWKIVALHILDH